METKRRKSSEKSVEDDVRSRETEDDSKPEAEEAPKSRESPNVETSRGDEATGPGILRLEGISKTSPRHIRTPSASSLRNGQVDSPTDRPSVKFALEEKDDKDSGQDGDSVFRSPSRVSRVSEMPLSPTYLSDRGSEAGDREEVEDDYSASVCAIIQRRNSSRRSRRKRRRKSSFASDDGGSFAGMSRRRSSVFTTSSGDTAISMEVDMAMEELHDAGTQEQIFENLKLHKEVLSSVKLQPWPLRRKVKLVQQAKAYVRSHEGALQERLALSRNTRDAVARASLFVNKKLQYVKREIVNMQTLIVPWEIRIKEIESHFGSAVASYFIFLRWLFWINLVVSLILTAFVAIPEVLTSDVHQAGERKVMLPEELYKSKHLTTLWEFEGILKYSPFFYGWYTNFDPPGRVYRLPLAYFLANLGVYTYSFVAILRKMAENSRMSKLSEKEDECAFSWKLFTGWDFMIGNPETAHNRIASIVLSFKEALLEEAEREKKLGRWKIITVRVFVNIAVMTLLVISAYAVVEVVARSTEPDANSGWWRQNEITVVMSLISYIFPIFFEILGILENYHPRKQLRFQLGRIMLLNLLNLYSLIFALFNKISDMEVELKSLKPIDNTNDFSVLSSSNCSRVSVPCDESSYGSVAALASLSLVLMSNVTSNTPNNRNNFYEARTNDSPDETLTGIDGFLDFGSTNTYNLLNTTKSTRQISPSSRTDVDISWNRYYNRDTEGQNYDYYDISQFVDPANDNSTTDSTSTGTPTSTESSVFASISSTEPDTNTTSTVNTLGTTPSSPNEANPLVGTPETRLVRCYVQICDACRTTEDRKKEPVTLAAVKKLNITTRTKLRKLCWETMFGQELAKLTMMDLVLTVIATLGVDFFRALFIRHMNSCWCWDLEKQFPQYGDFKIAENILHLVNNQGMVWMGMFFSPGLTALNLLKLGVLMYLRSWAVLSCNVPHEIVFRASRSNNFYLALLLTMLFLCVLPVGYAIVWVEPSWHCGPFSGYQKIYHMATQSLKDALPGKTLHKCLDYIASPGIVIPLIVLMALIIYYMVSLANSLREANNDLKIQLRQERTEERRKMFKIAEKRGQVQDTPFTRWKKFLPSGKSTETPVSRAIGNIFDLKNRLDAGRKRSCNSEADEATDLEQNSSLPPDPRLSPRDREERGDGFKKKKPKNGQTGIKDEKGTTIPKIRIDSTQATDEVVRDLSLEEVTFKSDSTI